MKPQRDMYYRIARPTMRWAFLVFLVFGSGNFSAAHATVDVQVEPGGDWVEHPVRSVDTLPGYTPPANDARSQYGGTMSTQMVATGYFRVEKDADRWWLVDPLGYPFISIGICVVAPGPSLRSQIALLANFGTQSEWANQTTSILTDLGFNTAAAWSSQSLIKDSTTPMPHVSVLRMVDSFTPKQTPLIAAVFMLGVTLIPYQGIDFIIVLYRNGAMVLNVATIFASRPAIGEQWMILRDVLKVVATVNFINVSRNLVESLFAHVPVLGRYKTAA